MSRITIPEVAAAPEGSQAALGAINAKLGRVPNFFRVLSNSPAVITAHAALNQGLGKALDLKTRPDAQKLERLAERWRPYRGVAARMLWAYYRVAKQRAGVIDLDTTSRLAEAQETG